MMEEYNASVNKKIPPLYVLSRERADEYASLLGIFNMGFHYLCCSWCSIVYHVFHGEHRILVYLTNADNSSASDQRIVVEIEVERDALWFNPHDKVDSSVGEMRLWVMQRLVSIGYGPALPLLREHKIGELLKDK